MRVGNHYVAIHIHLDVSAWYYVPCTCTVTYNICTACVPTARRVARSFAPHAGTGLVGCARVPGEERSEGDADRVVRAAIAPQHTCSVAMLLDPCILATPSLLTSPLEVTDFDQESRHGFASTSLALAAACRHRGPHTLAAARYLHIGLRGPSLVERADHQGPILLRTW